MHPTLSNKRRTISELKLACYSVFPPNHKANWPCYLCMLKSNLCHNKEATSCNMNLKEKNRLNSVFNYSMYIFTKFGLRFYDKTSSPSFTLQTNISRSKYQIVTVTFTIVILLRTGIQTDLQTYTDLSKYSSKRKH